MKSIRTPVGTKPENFEPVPIHPVGGVSDADYGLLAEYGMVRVIGVGDASYRSNDYSNMHRDPVIQLLTAYRAANPSEAQVADRILALVNSRADCFDRTCRPGHLTGSAWIVSPDGEQHLLLHHRKLDKWLQPGGHADGQTDLAEVALREATEETGLESLRLVPDANGDAALDLDVHDIPARYAPDGSLIEDGHEHHDVRFLFQAEGCQLGGNEESHSVRWFSENEVKKITQEISVLRLLEKAQRRLGRG